MSTGSSQETQMKIVIDLAEKSVLVSPKYHDHYLSINKWHGKKINK